MRVVLYTHDPDPLGAARAGGQLELRGHHHELAHGEQRLQQVLLGDVARRLAEGRVVALHAVHRQGTFHASRPATHGVTLLEKVVRKQHFT